MLDHRLRPSSLRSAFNSRKASDPNADYLPSAIIKLALSPPRRLDIMALSAAKRRGDRAGGSSTNISPDA